MEHVERAGDDLIDVGRSETRDGKAGELGKLVDQRFERADFAPDQAARTRLPARPFRFCATGGAERSRIALQAFGGKLNRGEWIFDFVGDALSDFLPGGGFLGAQ